MPKIIISSCNNGGGLYIFDTEANTVRRPQEKGASAGMIWWDYEKKIIAQYVHDTIEFRCVIGEAKCIDVKPISPSHSARDYHDLHLDGHKLWIVSAQTNCVEAYSVNTWQVVERKHVGPHNIPDIGHFNSVWMHRGILYGIIFSLSVQPEGWRNRPAAGVFFAFTEQGPTPLVDGLYKPHNIRVRENTATVCNSCTGELWVLKKKRRQWSIEKKIFVAPGFLRGCVEYKGGWLIGASVVRQARDMLWPDHAKKTGIPTSAIYHVLCDGTIKQKWEVGMPEIYDLLWYE